MLFSVVIPTYNRDKLLQDALASVLAQSFTDYEVIVVDNGSTDDTVKTLAKYGNRVRLFQQPNMGPGIARNLGVRHAVGEYAVFLDSDDLWFPWSLATYSTVIQRFDRPAFVSGKPCHFRKIETLASVKAAELDCNTFPDYIASGNEWRWWGASSFVIRRDAFVAVGGFPNEWINGEDCDLAMRLGDARGFIQVCAPLTFGYRQHEISEMKNFQRTLAGTRHHIRTEQECKYPGGPQRALQRWCILTRQIRPVALECLRRGMREEAWELFRATFRWHVRLGRWRFLAWFTLQAALPRS